MHRTTGKWKLGLTLALITALMWGALPIALKVLLDDMDVYAITWYRFLVASAVLGALLAYRRRIPRVRELSGHSWILLSVAILGLSANYLFYVLGLRFISPGNAQIVIQLAPMFLLIGGIVFFKEHFSRLQWLGLVVLIGGLGLFFNERLAELVSEASQYTVGVLSIFVSAIVWAAYALTQKQLLKDLPSDAIMLLIYIAAVILFFPLADLAQIRDLDGRAWGILIFCCFNTLLAYGSFAESLDHWEASRVSAVLALSPLLTFLFISVLTRTAPGFVAPEQLNSLSIAGAVIVVAGSMMTAMGRSNVEAKDLTRPPD